MSIQAVVDADYLTCVLAVRRCLGSGTDMKPYEMDLCRACLEDAASRIGGFTATIPTSAVADPNMAN